jgi:hypothetical protein
MVIFSANQTQLKISAVPIHWEIVIREDALTEECHAKLFSEKNIPLNGQGNYV